MVQKSKGRSTPRRKQRAPNRYGQSVYYTRSRRRRKTKSVPASPRNPKAKSRPSYRQTSRKTRYRRQRAPNLYGSPVGYTMYGPVVYPYVPWGGSRYVTIRHGGVSRVPPAELRRRRQMGWW